MAIFDDANRKITLTKDELDNYQFNNFNALLSEKANTDFFSGCSCIYNNTTYNYRELTSVVLIYNQTSVPITLSYFYTDDNPYWLIEDQVEYTESNLEYGLELVFTSTSYEVVKKAIQKDLIKFPDLVPTTNSETPEVLVKRGENGELSPNPAGFGFTQQVFINELPDASLAKPNTLYLVCVYNDNILVGYRPYKWTPTDGFVRVFNTNTPNLKAEDGGQVVSRNEVNQPKEIPEKVFSGKVVFNKAPTIEGKPLDEWVDTHGGVTEQEARNIANSAIQADKDIISKIEKVYDEDNDFTWFIFPKGIMPLSITLNTHELFLKNGEFVGRYGDEIEGYEFDDYTIEENGRLYWSFVGDLTEQVINSLSYIFIDIKSGSHVSLINSTYNLFFPLTLYQHYLEDQAGNNIRFTSDYSSIIDTVSKLQTEFDKGIAMSYYDIGLETNGLILSFLGTTATTLQVFYSDKTDSGSISTANFGTFTDTVTEL